MRDSIIFYRSFYEAIYELEPSVQAEVYTAIFEYSLNFKEMELSGLPKTIFTLIKPQLDANNRRFQNGKKGGRPSEKEPRKNQRITETEPKNNQTITETEANVNVNENVNENENKNGKGKGKRFTPPTIEEVKKYCLERKNSVDATKWHDHYTSNGWMVGKNKMKDWKAAVRTWEKNDFSDSRNDNGKQQQEVKFLN